MLIYILSCIGIGLFFGRKTSDNPVEDIRNKMSIALALIVIWFLYWA